MNILELFKANTKKRIIARGEAGKGGKTAGRGHKGQKSRTGFNIPNGFEGGQSTLTTRTPKKRGGLHKVNQYIILDFTKISDKLDFTKEISETFLLEKKIIQKNDLGKIIKLSNVPKTKQAELKLSNIYLTKKN